MRTVVSKLISRIAMVSLIALQFLAGGPNAVAGDVKVLLWGRNLSTPTGKLNREGVSELKRGHREKAKRLFYRAYLLDPQDPFTLNNLGYIAELEGDADRALRYYGLATKESTDAVIDESNEARLKGKRFGEMYHQIETSDHGISEISEQAIVLFEEGHIFEARNLLRAALPQHPDDPFLLNNLGYAMEQVGDLQAALRFYSAAASVHSTEPVVVTPRVGWRGRPISEIAAANAAAINRLIASGEGLEAAIARLNLQGVAALNDSRPQGAREFFLQAYRRDPLNAFTLNNLGYVTELNGDWETAEFYYEAARNGRDGNETVTYSTRREAEGQRVGNLASENRLSMEETLKRAQEQRRNSQEPVELIPRSAPPNAHGQDETAVPPVGVPAPALPPLPLPNSDQQRDGQKPSQLPTESPQP